MDSTRALPPRKNLTPTRISKQFLSPLQVLLQMGFQRHRAEKALAATGHRGAQLAADWLLAHVNDPTLDSSFPREYILYACPYGELLQRLELFWHKSLKTCGWNGAHNFMPHVTMVSFFKAPDECSLQLAQTLDQIVHQEVDLKTSSDGFTLEPYTSPNFMGLFVSEDNASVLKQIALQYVKEVSNAIINDNYEQLDAIATCFPWCTNATNRFSVLPKNMQAISLEPHVKSLHLTLAYQFQSEHFETLKQLEEEIIDPNIRALWEVRLYSRDSRVSGKQVYKVIYPYTPKECDELELRIGDYIYVDEDAVENSSDSWVEGISWLTGCSGFIPINYTERTAETESWTLHKSVPLFESDPETALLHGTNSDSLSDVELLNYDMASTVSLSSMATSNNQCKNLYFTFNPISPENITIPPYFQIGKSPINTYADMKNQNDIYIMRHGERIDFTFGNWISMCISKDGKYERKDLNMPTTLPKRAGYADSFKEDTPLTNIGVVEAKLTGEGMALKNITIKHAFCSPALRCIQTCHGVLSGLGVANEVPIKIEPGLFEWLTWYVSNYPDWMTEQELMNAGFNLDSNYTPLISKDALKERMSETCSQYYQRGFDVMQHILKLIKEQDGGSILVVAHASSLDTCSRQLTGFEPRPEEDMNRIMMKIPYCSLIKLQSNNTLWRIADSPVPCICHSLNKRFDSKILIDPVYFHLSN